MENQEFHKFDMHLFRDSMQNYKVYQIPKAADVPRMPEIKPRVEKNGQFCLF